VDAGVCDLEVVESREFHLRDRVVMFRFGEEVAKVGIVFSGMITSLACGERIAADMVMYSVGRWGVTEELQLEKAGLAADERGWIGIYTVSEISSCGKTEVELTRSAVLYEVGEVPLP
jgi:pyruvate/2-oxoglutarate dehydrogenase complex dihydrolipoamide dehydrogenase (E3) component